MAKEDIAVKAAERTAEVTYVPGEGDPVKTVLNGITFHANMPVTIPYSKTIDQLLRVETVGPEGDTRSKGAEKKVCMVEALRGNPFFSVDGVQAPRKHGTQRLPTDADQYRGYAIAWIRASNTSKQLEQRWQGEEALREKCGLEDRDVSYLMPFLEARREQLREAA